jgi:putative transposase
MINQAIEELVSLVGVKAACQAVGRPRGSHYRWHRTSPPPPKPERVASPQPRALSEVERKQVLRVLHDPDHVDEAPATVYAKLLDQGVYLCSVPTMYRLLRTEGEVTERRRQASHPPTVKPELLATRPNQVWSWDITKLLGPAKWTWFYLTRSSTSTAAMCPAGCWPGPSERSWPSGCWPTPSPSRPWHASS